MISSGGPFGLKTLMRLNLFNIGGLD
uniref:Uncharacterized protein n=1 Tax=Nelumbo nucifera TaxID=4432 RepID=A0A822ZIT9_NELNU|nr:TPA_asm: hypothetical protein HUJ06_015941 [Nelumbo nucifera]